MKQFRVWTVLGIWAALSLAGALYAGWQGYGGRPFAATVTAFGVLLLGQLIFAAKGVAEKFATGMGPAAGILTGVTLFLVYLVYLLGTGTFSVARAATMAGFLFVPIALALISEGASPGTWQDFLIIAAVWVFVKFGPTHWLWPYPGERLAYILTVLMAVNAAIATFLLVRRAPGVGYTLGWGKNWTVYIAGSLVAFACVAIPAGLRMHFLEYAPKWGAWASLALTSVAILVFTAWPEELLFRGLLQNLLSRASKSEFAGWWTASMVFGFSHIANMHFPNWPYVILAAAAGLFYGWVWKRTGSIFASALLHAAVDVLWHFVFRS